MAVGRPYWKGYLKLSLVSCPIALYTATSSGERVSFRQINTATGNRLKQLLVDEVTREPVDPADKGRGFEFAKNQYIEISDEELDAIKVESTETIEIDRFVPHAQIDERYFDSTYYIAPDGRSGQDAFAVIREAMRIENMVALGKAVLSRRERVIMLQPWGPKGIMGTALRYANEVRNPEAYFEDLPDIPVGGEMLDLAKHILQTKSGDFEPETFVDRYEEAVLDLLKRKQAGLPQQTQEQIRAPTNVVNIMDALRRSLEAEGVAAKPATGKAKAAPKAKGKKRAEGQREMPLPVVVAEGRATEAPPAAKTKPARGRKAG